MAPATKIAWDNVLDNSNVVVESALPPLNTLYLEKILKINNLVELETLILDNKVSSYQKPGWPPPQKKAKVTQ